MYAWERNSIKKYFLFRHIIHIFSMVHWWVLMVHSDIQSSEQVSLTQPVKRAQLELIWSSASMQVEHEEQRHSTSIVCKILRVVKWSHLVAWLPLGGVLIPLMYFSGSLGVEFRQPHSLNLIYYTLLSSLCHSFVVGIHFCVIVLSSLLRLNAKYVLDCRFRSLTWLEFPFQLIILHVVIIGLIQRFCQ